MKKSKAEIALRKKIAATEKEIAMCKEVEDYLMLQLDHCKDVCKRYESNGPLPANSKEQLALDKWFTLWDNVEAKLYDIREKKTALRERDRNLSYSLIELLQGEFNTILGK